MIKMICFDMDGTIADLYSVNNWLPMLREENPAPYAEAEPMWDMEELSSVCADLMQAGIEIRVITWLSKNSSEEYKEAVREAKKAWCKKWGFTYNHFHGVQYGATKADSIRKYLEEEETAILVDDNEMVRNGWHMGETINPTTCDLIETLKNILKNL